MTGYEKLFKELFDSITDTTAKSRKTPTETADDCDEMTKELSDKILKKIKDGIAADEEERQRKSVFTSYDPAIYKKYLFVYEPFISGKHKELEPEYETYFKKFLAEDEEILQHFITVKKETYTPVDHLFFTNKQVIAFTPLNECASYAGTRFMEFISYQNIVYHTLLGGPSERTDTPLGMEFQIRNSDLRFIDFLTEQQAIDLIHLITSHI